jgi:hypothetical protein
MRNQKVPFVYFARIRILKGKPCLVGINYLFVLVFGSDRQVLTTPKYRFAGDSCVEVLHSFLRDVMIFQAKRSPERNVGKLNLTSTG